MRITRRFAFAVTLVPIVCAALWFQPGSQGKPPPADPVPFEEDLGEFFANLARYSPTVLGELSDDADTLIAIRESIRQLSPEELASIESAFTAVPNWRMVPEMLAASVPPETLRGMELTVRQAAAQAAELRAQPTEQMVELRALQSELDSLYALARLLPPETLERVDLDQASLAAAQDKLRQLQPQRLIHVNENLGKSDGWQTARTRLPMSVPQEIRRGTAALARNGEIGSDDARELTDLRQELESFLADVESLPATVSPSMDKGAVAELRQKLSSATPEMLFVLREEIDSPQLQAAIQDARMLAGAGSMSATERAELEEFRGAMTSALSIPVPSAQAAANLDALHARYAESTDAELLLARKRIARVPDWQKTVPAVLEASSTSTVGELVDGVLLHGSVEPEVLTELLSFREHLLYYFEELQGRGGPEAEHFAKAAQSLETANVIELAVMHEAYIRQADLAGAEDVSLYGLADMQLAVTMMTPEVYLGAGVIGPSCSIPGITIPELCAPSIDIPYVGVIEVCLPSVSTPSIDLQSICDAIFNPLNSALQVIQGVLDSIGGVADSITTTLVDIVQNIDELPALVGSVFISAFEAIAEAAGLNDFLDPANLGALLGIAGSFWDSIPVVPTPPCPADGTDIPLFGDVGEKDTAVKYARYLFIFDKLLELIPDTVYSLPILIPAQVLYSGVQYLEVCLESAADLRDETETGVFRASVAAQFVVLQAALADVDSGLGSAQLAVDGHAAATSSALSSLDSKIASLQGDLDGHASQLTGVDTALGDRLGETTQMLLRLEVEANLVEAAGDHVASFLLPEEFGGYLEIVRQIVDETIQRNLAAGLDVHDALAALQQGDDWLAIDDYVNAYGQYGKAYREAVR